MNATPESAAAFVLIVIALALGYVWHLCHIAPEMTARQERADRARVEAMRAAQARQAEYAKALRIYGLALSDEERAAWVRSRVADRG